MELFPSEQIVGIFRGFREGGMEFHADLVLPYRNDFQSIPMHGQFLLVQLETPDEAVLGRIASFSSDGKLSFGSGEEFNLRAVREGRAVPEDLREQYLKYRVNIRVLGVLRNGADGKPRFVASHRRLPHVGSAVALPSSDVLREIAGHNEKGAELGHFALGEYVYASGSDKLAAEDWMQTKEPEVLVKFPIESLVSRRSFIFARAGFGKSNLNKLLFSKLYAQTPTVEKRGGKRVPVGTIIFDPDGEYFWPDDKGRPGLCDVPELQDKIVVFTDREGPSDFYQSFVADGIKLDIRRLNPSDVISIALSPERQNQQNVHKLRGLSQSGWEELVNLVDATGNQTDPAHFYRILHLTDNQEMEALAARSNMTRIVRSVHDKTSQLMDKLLHALSKGKLCVIDVSRMREGQSLILSGLILRKIFDRNQEEFTAKDPKTIPTIAVVEEAQSVLNERATAAEPYIAWVKEGRKYDLGALLITQQPGSIPNDILSQGDNWFIFHLLSSTDLTNVRKANAHFSEDLLSALLNEPIPGQGVYWSSVGGKPYPVAIRALSFEQMYRRLDENYDRAAVPTFAAEMKREFDQQLQEAMPESATPERKSSGNGRAPARIPRTAPFSDSEDFELDELFPDDEPAEKPDVKETFERNAIQALKVDKDLMQRIENDGVAYGAIKAFLRDRLPETMEDRDQLAYDLVSKALNEIFGPQDKAWHSYRNEQRNTRYVRVGGDPEHG